MLWCLHCLQSAFDQTPSCVVAIIMLASCCHSAGSFWCWVLPRCQVIYSSMMHDTRLIINVARRMIPQVRSQNSRRQVSAGVISKGVIAVVRMMLSRRKARKANGIEGRGSTRFLKGTKAMDQAPSLRTCYSNSTCLHDTYKAHAPQLKFCNITRK